MRFCGVLALAAFAFVGCMEEKVSGGGSDQPNKVHAGRILTDNGRAAANAQVIAWAGTWDPVYSRASGTPLDTTHTDTSGRWSLELPKSNLWFVTAMTPGYTTVSLPGQTEARLIPEAVLKGIVHRPPGLTVESVWLGGSCEPIKINWYDDSTGSFSQRVFAGSRRIWASVRWEGGSDSILVAERDLAPGDNPSIELAPDTGSTLILSADASPVRSALRGIHYDARNLDAGKWFTSLDVANGGASKILPAGFPDTDSAIKLNGSVGRYFEWRFQWGGPIQLDNGVARRPFAGVGLRLSTRDLDWSKVRGLRIWCNGGDGFTGRNNVWVQLNSSEIDKLGSGEHFRFKLSLPSGWSVQNIPVEAFAPPAGSKPEKLGYDWNRIKQSIHDIAFYAADSETVLQLKEVRVLGSRPKDW